MQEVKVIVLFNKAFQTFNIFKTDVELFHYLNRQGSAEWHFNHYPHKSLASFLEEEKGLEEKSFIYMASQAVRQEQSMIVMCKGDVENPSLFLVTPELDISALQKEWIKLYCAAHDLYVLQE